jgi:hypothetical protein
MSDTKPTAAKPAATKEAAKDTAPKTAPVVADADEDTVVLPKPALNTTSAAVATSKNDPAAGLSSVGAELHPDAKVANVAGAATLDAGGPYVSEAPAPTPAAAVAYPSTGGLPDTGPNSKYVLGAYAGPELYNRDGQRVNADGQLIDDFGNIIVASDVDLTARTANRRVSDTNMMRQNDHLSEQTKAEMDAGKRALDNR